MKKIFFSIIAAVAMLSMTSCEKDLETYSTETCRLNFYYNDNQKSYFSAAMTESSYSFIYAANDVTVDTVWVEVESMGFVRDYDRRIALVQVDTAGVDQAIAGTHYVAFNDPSFVDKCIMPAGKARTRIPIVVKRDSSLKKQTVVLKYRIDTNNEFTNGFDRFQTRSLTITDRLAKPAKWDEGLIELFGGFIIRSLGDEIGEWGPLKHQFMIDTVGKPWDDKYIEELCTGDESFRNYIFTKLGKALVSLNAERAAQGLDRLAEEDGTVITFKSYSGDK